MLPAWQSKSLGSRLNTLHRLPPAMPMHPQGSGATVNPADLASGNYTAVASAISQAVQGWRRNSPMAHA